MPEQNSSAPPLRAFEPTIREQLRVLHQEGILEKVGPASGTTILGRVRALPWVPAVVLITEVALATGGRKVRLVGDDLLGWMIEHFGLTKEEAEEFQSGKMRAAAFGFMNLELFDVELGEFVDEGWLKASGPGDRDAVRRSHPELLPPYSRPGDARIRTFKTWERGLWLRAQGLVDGKLLWSRAYRSFPCISYRLAWNGEQTRAKASAEAETPEGEGADGRPKDLIPLSLVEQDFIVSAKTIRRRISDKKLIDYRTPEDRPHGPILVSRAAVGQRFLRRPRPEG